MRNFPAYVLLVAMVALTSLVAQDKKAPAKLVFPARNGNVTYDHAAHAKRENNDCKVCHPALFPQDAKAPLAWKAAMHRTAETAKTSCGKCHTPGGAAFETKGNCTSKCHNKGGEKKA
jgi:c(7)-type cytochrome triheme protein